MTMLILVIEGKLTTGYYNAMEAGNPIFIDGEVIDDKIKDWLDASGYDSDLCYYSERDRANVSNPLIGRRIKVTVEIEGDPLWSP